VGSVVGLEGVGEPRQHGGEQLDLPGAEPIDEQPANLRHMPHRCITKTPEPGLGEDHPPDAGVRLAPFAFNDTRTAEAVDAL